MGMRMLKDLLMLKDVRRRSVLPTVTVGSEQHQYSNNEGHLHSKEFAPNLCLLCVSQFVRYVCTGADCLPLHTADTFYVHNLKA